MGQYRPGGGQRVLDAGHQLHHVRPLPEHVRVGEPGEGATSGLRHRVPPRGSLQVGDRARAAVCVLVLPCGL